MSSNNVKIGKNKGKVLLKKGKGKSGSKAPTRELVKVVDTSLELPHIVYKLTIKEFNDICRAFHAEAVGGEFSDPFKVAILSLCNVDISITPDEVFQAIGTKPEELGPDKTANLLSMLREHEDQSVVSPLEDLEDEEEVSSDHLTSQPYDIKELYALFYLYEEKKYKYIKIKIAKSKIAKAGMGIYALEDIPEGAVGQYKGVPRIENYTNMYYSWVVKSFDPQEGLPDDSDLYMYYIDATDLSRSNWTRYVNCGMKNDDNNMDQEQVYDKIYYTVTRDIKAGEELYVDYGEDYRVYNLEITEEDYY